LSGSSREVTNTSEAFLPRVWVTWTPKLRQCARYDSRWEELPSCSEFPTVFIEKSQDTSQESRKKFATKIYVDNLKLSMTKEELII